LLIEDSSITNCEKEKQTLETNKKMVFDFYQELFGDKN